MVNKESVRITTDTPTVYLYIKEHFENQDLRYFEDNNKELSFQNKQGTTHDELIEISEEYPNAKITGRYTNESTQHMIGFEIGYHYGGYKVLDVELNYQLHYGKSFDNLTMEQQGSVYDAVHTFFKDVDTVISFEDGTYEYNDHSDKEVTVSMYVDELYVTATKIGRAIDIVDIA